VRRLFGIDMPLRTVGEYLLRRGFTPQRPAHRADETAVKRDGHRVRGHAPGGQTPLRATSARWTSISTISAITRKGVVRFAFHEGAIDGDPGRLSGMSIFPD
jgi:hypothetical protein